MKRLWIAMSGAAMSLAASGYEQAYPRTEPGVFEIKRLPAVRAITAECPGAYFGSENRLFMRLFGYVRDHGVRMTTPVESRTESARMRFFAGRTAPASLPSVDGVEVEVLGERVVASAGARGAYSRANIEKTLGRLRAWLAEQGDWVEDGAPSAAYWNSPFVPWFLKKYEVHIPVRRANEAGHTAPAVDPRA